MKKIFLISAVLLMSIASRATLTVYNNTCATVYFSIGCHDANYSCCGCIHSDYFTLTAGHSMFFNNTQSLGYCFVPGSYLPSVTQNWDVCTYTTASDGLTPANSWGDSITKCGGTWTQSSPGAFCLGTVLLVGTSVSGTATTISFNLS